MKIFYPVLFVTVWISACSTAAPIAVQNSNFAANDERAQNTISHGPTEQTGASNSTSTGRWSQSGDPIDTSKYDKAIAVAEKNHKSKPADVSATQSLAQAYFERGFALTEARQYASALGDYRSALKLDPDHADAKQWERQIISIYQMLKKTAPNEGEEPPPLPFPAGSNGAERIEFRSGATSSEAAGRLTGYADERAFLIEVEAGQTLRTEQVGAQDRRITIYVESPSGKPSGDSDASCNSRREIAPTEAGDYRLRVVECRKADPWNGDFRFKVSAN